jgi:hypothetical protein
MKGLFNHDSSSKQKKDEEEQEDVACPQQTAALDCCQGIVHIAYRGVSDERMYLAENRKAAEVKFFRPNGLRVFCAGCRKRLQ